MEYTVRRTSAANARDALLRLWARNLNVRGDPLDKFCWFYRDNPLGEAQGFLLAASSEPSAEPVGCCGLGDRILYIDGQPHRAGLLADFAVDRGHRTVRPALVIQRALSDYSKHAFDLTYGFPNESAVGVLQRVGFPVLGRMGRYVRVLRYASIVHRYLFSAPLAAVGGSLIDALAKVSETGRVAMHSDRMSLTWLSDVDSRFDTLWEAARIQHGCIGDRSQQFLRWRFARRPGLPAAFATLVDRPGGGIAAYAAVVEKEAGVALVADFLARSHGELRTLFERLFPELRRRGFKTAVTFFLGSHAVARTLTSSGFSFRQSAKFVVSGAGSSGAIEARTVAEPQRWYLTEADRDN
jgi:GNAT superfamily N-acetyltransferase